MSLAHHFSTPAQAVDWLKRRVTGVLRVDSRQVTPGDGFIAWPGAALDGRQFVAQALAQGAAACLVEQQGVEAFTLEGDAVASYPQLKAATGPIAAAYYEHPSAHIDLLAVTGTNGKTSTTWWLAQALQALPAPRPCAVVGTLGTGVPPDLDYNGLTTPDPVLLQRQLRGFVAQGLACCAIEASSIGLAERRLDGTRIRVAIFTNLTHDHLDYHGDMASYWQAKAELFRWPGLQAAVVNVDDPQGLVLLDSLASGLDVWSYGLDPAAQPRLQARAVRYATHDAGYGLVFDVCEGAQTHALQTSLIGQYNVSNLLAVIGTLRALGIPLAQAVAATARVGAVPGRMECMAEPGQPMAVIDYAHTPDALDKALSGLRPLVQARGGQLWCVFGCGGGRDSAKRPVMAALAERDADQVVITSDNPRFEKPEAIISQILLGLSHGQARERRLHVEPLRELAIRHALCSAAPEDVVLIAGKGHEDYQEVAGVRHPFSDQAQARAALAHRTCELEAQRMRPQMTLAQAFDWIRARIPAARLVGDPATPLQRVHTDSRSLAAGDLFVALKGERFDANAFLPQARAAGAVAALAHGGLERAGLAGIEVPDTTLALGALAAGWRQQFTLPVIAVTGSNGKTTVTQMLASVLHAAHGERALATLGNFNNAIGVPLTLLRLRASHQVAVLELGMNHPGEIAYLADLVRPTVALVNNAQREHLEFMHSVDAVARENASVFSALDAQGVAVFPAHDSYSALWTQLAAPRQVCGFALDDATVALASADAAHWQGGAWDLRLRTPQGEVLCQLRIAGRHNVVNALAATACALAAGIAPDAVARGLDAFEPVKGRSRALAVPFGARTLTVVDDSYNANPDSVRAAIDVLAELPGPRLLVLGDMGEVGDQGPAFHAEAGAHAQAVGIEQVFALGELARHTVAACAGARHFTDIAALQQAVLQQLPVANSVLVKGSRFMQMERVVQALVQHGTNKEEDQC